MDDFLSSRTQISTPRNGSAQKRGEPTQPAALGQLKAEVRTSEGKLDPSREPQVETVVVNGAIQRIHIHCKCGEEIILHCEYPQ
jgi:hypothetical protein